MSIYTPAEQAERVTGGWIPVGADLPKPHPDPLLRRRVMVSCPDYDEGEAQWGHYLHTLKAWFIAGSPTIWNVTHWQPLPAPPEEG